MGKANAVVTQLQGYLQEIADNLHADSAPVMSAASLQNHVAWRAMLHRMEEHCQSAIEAAQADAECARGDLISAQVEKLKFATVLNRQHARVEAQLAKKEQKMMDEFAAIAYRRQQTQR